MGFKRIIDGKSYNTDTATLIHDFQDERGMKGENLYQTKHGAYFLFWFNNNFDAGDIKPLPDDLAQKWLEDNQADASIIEQHFGEMPEAGSAERRITLRLPGNLYSRVLASSTAAELSLNTYIMRLLERSQAPVVN